MEKITIFGWIPEIIMFLLSIHKLAVLFGYIVFFFFSNLIYTNNVRVILELIFYFYPSKNEIAFKIIILSKFSSDKSQIH